MRQSLRHHIAVHSEEARLAQWFDPLVISANAEEKSLAVAFPHTLFGQWFDQAFKPAFELACKDICPDYRISYKAAPKNSSTSYSGLIEPPSAVFPALQDFGAKFTFDTFLTNRKNQFPLISAKKIAEKGSTRIYNPFVVTGASGSGKTHLLRAIANEVRAQRGYSSIFFANAEEISEKGLLLHGYSHRSFFSEYDMLIIDDIQRINPFHDLQKDISFLCDIAREMDKQLVIACSGRLSEHQFIQPGLLSRLESGLCVELREPDLDIRARFLLLQCRVMNIRLTKDQILLLAQRFKQLRSLEGILLKIAAYCSLINRKITGKELDQILEHTDGGDVFHITPEHIISITSAHFGLMPSELTGVSRKYHVVLARQFAMLLCRELTAASYPALGKFFGGKDHTTAIYAVKKINQLRKHNKDIQQTFSLLKQLCTNVSPQGRAAVQ